VAKAIAVVLEPGRSYFVQFVHATSVSSAGEPDSQGHRRLDRR
jgi:hypothetical protein